MNTRPASPWFALFAVLCLTALPSAADAAKTVKDLPAWLRDAMNQGVEGLAGDAGAVKIVDFESVVFSPDGTSVTETRCAYRVLSANGLDDATARIRFINKQDKVTDVSAWLVLASGEVREYKDKDFIRAENSEYTRLYTESWTRFLSFNDAIRPGCVIAWTYKVQAKEILPDDRWYLRNSNPILESLLIVRVPQGWEVRRFPMNHPDIQESFDGTTYICHSANQPALKDEPGVPPGSASPYVGYSIVPSAKDKPKCRIIVLDNWNAVATYDGSFMDPQALPDDAIKAKVAALTASCDSTWKKIQVLAAYAQDVNYISVDMNLRSGGGLKPNSAASVFAHNYGDCKDKTALLRAMLSCIGVESYAVGCLLSYSECVNPDWPSECTFNHCTIAIRVPEEVHSEALVQHPDLGRLLLFDPTDESTPIGFISDTLGGTYYLLCSPNIKGLSEFPQPNAARKETIEAALDASGRLSGTIREDALGTSANYERDRQKSQSTDEYKRMLSEWIRGQTRNATLVNWSVHDDKETNCFRTDLSFDAPGFCKRIGATKLLFKGFLPYASSSVPDKPKNGTREYSYLVHAGEKSMESRITLPEGYEVDELPRDITLDEPFGHVELHASSANGVITLHMTVKMLEVVLPPSDFERFRNFCKASDKAMQASIVIRQKAPAAPIAAAPAAAK